MDSFVVVNPYRDETVEFNFKNLHYFRWPSLSHMPDEKRDCYSWLIWTDGPIELSSTYIVDDEYGDSHAEVELETKTQVKGMIELQQSPYEYDVIWLKFVTIREMYRGKGFSKEMIKGLVSFFQERFPGKTLMRSRPSEDGVLKLMNNMSNALDEAKIKHRFS